MSSDFLSSCAIPSDISVFLSQGSCLARTSLEVLLYSTLRCAGILTWTAIPVMFWSDRSAARCLTSRASIVFWTALLFSTSSKAENSFPFFIDCQTDFKVYPDFRLKISKDSIAYAVVDVDVGDISWSPVADLLGASCNQDVCNTILNDEWIYFRGFDADRTYDMRLNISRVSGALRILRTYPPMRSLNEEAHGTCKPSADPQLDRKPKKIF